MTTALLRRAIMILFATALPASAAGKEPETDQNAQRELLLSTLWYQRAPEFQLIARSVFKHAEQQLPSAVQIPGTAAPEQRGQDGVLRLPPAVIVDLDETMLDNSAYQAHLVATHLSYDHDQSWRRWVGLRKAMAIPGAVDFSNAVVQGGATIFYVSNRSCGADPKCAVLDDTMANMQQLGFARANDRSAFLLKKMKPEWDDEKSSRRVEIAKTHRIVMLVGDNLYDFMPAPQADKLANADIDTHDYALKMLGTRWFVLPNPMYGSWLNKLNKPAKQETALQKMYSELEPVNFNQP